MTIEQRKYIRFLTKKKTFAALRSGFDKVGRILDISINGLAFCYILEDAIKADHFQVDIFQSDNEFYLSNIPCRVIYDIPKTNQKYDTIIQPRRCGLCFGKLSNNQKDNLLIFLKNSTKATIGQRGKNKIAKKRISGIKTKSARRLKDQINQYNLQAAK